MPLAVAGVVALAAGARRLRRVGWTFAAFAVVGLALTLLAAWVQGRGHGG
jgi:hypothetical protein